MSDEHETRTPTVEEASAYWQWGGRMWQAPERFERMIAKIKADARIAAWKEVAEFMRTQTSDNVTVLRAAHLAATTIYYRASQIEQEEA